MGLRPLSNFYWENHHANQNVTARVHYDVTNDVPANNTAEAMFGGFRSYLQVLSNARNDNHSRVRFYGGAWSLSSVAMVPDYMVNTGYTDYIVPGLGAEYSPAADRNMLVLAQCGATVGLLNDTLWGYRLALPTSGASNGQTIAGALATGTHGAAFNVGSMPDYVCAVHLVTPSGSYWVEDPSDPITTPQLRSALPGELLQDAKLFRSTLVSIGSLGLVHAVVLRCVAPYKLTVWIDTTRTWSDIESGIANVDLATLGLSGIADLHHLEAIIHPYTRKAYLRYMAKAPAAATSTKPPPGKMFSADVLNFATALEDDLSIARDLLVDAGINADFPAPLPFTAQPGVVFGPTGANPSSKRRKGLSTEIGMRPSDLPQFFELAFAVAARTNFLGSYSIRIVKQGKATLGWTSFGPYTATVEAPMLENADAVAALTQIFSGLRTLGIPHSFHWGQCLPAESPFHGGDRAAAIDQVLATYAADGRLDAWRNARSEFLFVPEDRAMFSNDLTTLLGL